MLIVPGVARFAVNQTLEGRAVVNVLDYFIDTTGSTMSRSDAVDGQAGSIFEQWANRIMPGLADDLALNSVSFVDLDSATGTTGSRVSGGGFTAPIFGGQVTATLPANTAALGTKTVPSARGRRNGRVFQAGMLEDSTEGSNGNLLLAAAVSARNTAWDNFLTDTNELDALGTAFSSNMVVVHITSRDVNGNPLTGDSSIVQSITFDALLATQRRRLRG